MADENIENDENYKNTTRKGKPATTPIVDICGITIEVDAYNYTVFDGTKRTYHGTLHNALSEVSSIILKKKMVVKASAEIMSLNKLIAVIEAHDAWFKEVSKGY